MDIFFGVLLALSAFLLCLAEYYMKSMYTELESLRIENVALRLKLDELKRSQNDDSSNL